MAPATAAKSFQLWPTLCDPKDGSPPGSSVHGICPARVLEWGAIAFSVINGTCDQLLINTTLNLKAESMLTN